VLEFPLSYLYYSRNGQRGEKIKRCPYLPSYSIFFVFIYWKDFAKNSVWNAFGTLSFLDPLCTALRMSRYTLKFDAQDLDSCIGVWF